MIVAAIALLQARDLTPREIVARYLDSVVSVESRTKTGTFFGSGFLIGDGRTVATAFHVIRGATLVTVITRDGVRHLPIAFDDFEGNDTAVMLLRYPTGRKPIPIGRTNTLEVGDPVVALGDPLGLSGSASNGIVSAMRKQGAFDVVQFTAPISPGSSGGPLIDGRGLAVGIVRSTFENGQNLNLAAATGMAKAGYGNLHTRAHGRDHAGTEAADYYAKNERP